MSYKLKHDSIDDFSKELAARICDRFFKDHDHANGQHMMSISGSKQTDLLLIKRLFGKWQSEIEQLESPYFDFQTDEVRDALKEFGNVLSRHINIGREHLEPLLESAIADSVYIHFDPGSFYSYRLLEKDEEMVDTLKELSKYLKTNAEKFFEVLGKLKKKAVSKTDLSEKLQKKYQTNDVVDFDPSDFLTELDATDMSEMIFEQIAEVREEVEEVHEVGIEEEEELAPEIEDNGAAINEKFSQSKKTIADELKKQVVKDIESSLTLNEKFMFINGLFNGNKDEFKEALKSLELSTSYDEAKSKVENSYDWDMETEEAEAFLEVLERRFP